jgi:hypothetical protein
MALCRLPHAGTCSLRLFRWMELENIGALPVDNDRLRRLFTGDMAPGTRAAISDLSICKWGKRRSVHPEGHDAKAVGALTLKRG